MLNKDTIGILTLLVYNFLQRLNCLEQANYGTLMKMSREKFLFDNVNTMFNIFTFHHLDIFVLSGCDIGIVRDKQKNKHLKL